MKGRTNKRINYTCQLWQDDECVDVTSIDENSIELAEELFYGEFGHEVKTGDTILIFESHTKLLVNSLIVNEWHNDYGNRKVAEEVSKHFTKISKEIALKRFKSGHAVYGIDDFGIEGMIERQGDFKHWERFGVEK